MACLNKLTSTCCLATLLDHRRGRAGRNPALGALRAGAAGLLLAAAPWASAQFDHTVYGVLDLSYGRFQPSGALRSERFNSNSLTASFAGLSASYGFENGWTTGIVLEAFYRFQDMRAGRNDNDPLLSRNAFVSLAHRDWGTLRAGRLQTLLFSTAARFNAFGNSVAFSPALRHVFAAGNIIGVQEDFYWDRAVSYTLPAIDGLTAAVMAARGEGQSPGQHAGATVIATQGLLALAASWQRVHIDDGIADPVKESAWQLSGSYNAGWAQGFAQWTHTRDQGQQLRSNSVSAGLTVPAGPGSVLAQIAVAKAEGLAIDRKQTTTSLGYVYPWDSLTDLYLLGMDDRVRGQTRGASVALGVRLKF